MKINQLRSTAPYVQYKVIACCFFLSQEADKRPSFSDLLQLLSGLLEQGNYPYIST